MLNIEEIRKEFPILDTRIYNKPLVYLDNAATTQKPKCVIDTISNVYSTMNSNVHRGIHHLSQVATTAMENSRETIREFIGAKHSHEIIFTRGTTESINLVASSFGNTFLKDGDEIIISAMEHHSNIVPWQLLHARKGVNFRVIPLTEKYTLDIEAYKQLFNEKTRLVSMYLLMVHKAYHTRKLTCRNSMPISSRSADTRFMAQQELEFCMVKRFGSTPCSPLMVAVK